MTSSTGPEPTPAPAWAALLGEQNLVTFRRLRRAYLTGLVLPVPAVAVIYFVAAVTHTDVGTALWPRIAALALAYLCPLVLLYPIDRFSGSLAKRAEVRLGRALPPLRFTSRRAALRWCRRIGVEWRDLAERPTVRLCTIRW